MRVELDVLPFWDCKSEQNQLRNPERNYDDCLNGKDKNVDYVLFDNKFPCLVAGDQMAPQDVAAHNHYDQREHPEDEVQQVVEEEGHYAEGN